MEVKFFFFNPYYERCYVAWDRKGVGVIFDPGCMDEGEREGLFDFIQEKGIRPKAVLLTHAHFDHIYGVRACIDKYGIPVYMHPDEKIVTEGAKIFAEDCKMPVPDTSWDTLDVREGDILEFGELSFRVIVTPGHSPGSVCYYCGGDEKQLFSGDTLFAGTIGNTAHRWGDYDKEIVSIMDKLMGLDSDVKVHPGHGCGTTIGYERTSNPFLQPFNYKDPETGYVDGIEFR